MNASSAFPSRRLGRTDVAVTTLGYGGAPIGGFRFALSEQQAVETIRTALSAGVRYFDTSPYYGYGRSEHLFGQALRSVPRDSYVLSTKVGRTMSAKRDDEIVEGYRAGGLPFKPTYDYSADGAYRSLEQSLLRLGMNRIDVVFIHDVDVWTHGSQAEADRRFAEAMAGCYPALAKLRSEGVIRAIGVGLNDSEMCVRFAREADLDCIMLAGRYTLLEQGAIAELLPLCQEKMISILLAGPFNSGILATGAVAGAPYDYKPAPDAVMDRVRRIESTCRRHGVELATAALQFPLAHSALASAVVGSIHPHEVQENAARMTQSIPVALWADLKREGLLHPDAPVPAR